nr:RecName: Full=Calcium-binding shell glycoprotein P29 [Unio pictorum]
KDALEHTGFAPK